MKTRRQHRSSEAGWEGGSTGVRDHGMRARLRQELGRSLSGERQKSAAPHVIKASQGQETVDAAERSQIGP